MSTKKNPYSMPMYLPSTLDEKWKSTDNCSCLVGTAQIAIIWLKLYEINDYNGVVDSDQNESQF